MNRNEATELVDAIVEIARYGITTWGTGGIGLALLRRALTDEPWVSIGDLEDELILSRAQIRRRLNDLVKSGQVWRKNSGDTHCYRISEEHANEAFLSISTRVALQNGKGVSYTDLTTYRPDVASMGLGGTETFDHPRGEQCDTASKLREVRTLHMIRGFHRRKLRVYRQQKMDRTRNATNSAGVANHEQNENESGAAARAHSRLEKLLSRPDRHGRTGTEEPDNGTVRFFPRRRVG